MKEFIIAILGRPNVGKSTLFNRLVGKRQSIVADVEGVTRDRIYGKLEWLEQKYKIIDTGGYLPKTNDLIEKQVRYQADIASREADMILFVIDGREELTSNDKILASLVNKLNKPTILVVNKMDSKKSEEEIFYYYELGFKHLVCISSQSGRQVGLLLDKIKLINPNISKLDSFPNSISFAIVGMPNVGKSSLMNSLIKSNKSIVTNIAGTTRDAIDSYITYYKQTIRIIDTAGLRRKSKINDSIEYYSNVRTFNVIDECDVATILIDVSKGFDNQDKNIIRYIIEKGKGLLVIVNKWDLVENKETNTMKMIMDDMEYSLPNIKYYPIKFISIKNNFKIGEVLKQVLQIHKRRKTKISTSKLNVFLENIIRHYPPPSTKGKEIKINYITQIHHSPPRFAFFANYPDYISDTYKRYLENRIREEFDFEGIPIRISIRKK